jgi:Sigma-70, region 4
MARPLTKKAKDGNLYVRPRAIEAKIDGALGQDWSVLAQRAKQNDRQAADFLPNEALLHLAREAVRRGDERLANVLMGPLLKRVEANLMKTVPDGRLRNAEAVRDDVLDDLMTMIAQDGTPGHEDDLDYFEVNFAHALKTMRINHVRKETTYRKELVELPETEDEDGDLSFDADALARLSRAAQTGASQEHSLELDELIEKVRQLPEDERKAVILTRIIGYDEKTAGQICDGVTDRTIRNRLKRATKRLKDDGEKK